MRVLIVGCGYVGLALGSELSALGHQMFGLRRGTAFDAQLRGAGLQPLQADIARPETLTVLPGPFDWVVNTVSASGGGAEDYRRAYLEGTRNLLHWLQRIPPARFVYTSSTGVYGQNDGSVVTEDSPTEPGTATGDVLLETEQMLREAAHSGFPAIILRVAGIYGPGRGYWLRQFLNGEARLEGTGDRVLNMIHREDVAGSIHAALRNGQTGAVYNVADDEPVTQVDLFRWLSQTLCRPMPPVVPKIEDPGRKRGLTSKRVSNRRLRSELGYSLRYPTFREGFEAEIGRGPSARQPSAGAKI